MNTHILTPDIEAQTLALLTLRAMGNIPFTTTAYIDAMPVAYTCLLETKVFLKQKEREEEAEDDAYWNSEEGQKRREEARIRFEAFKKRNNP